MLRRSAYGVMAALVVGSALLLAPPAQATEVATTIDGMQFVADDADPAAGAALIGYVGTATDVIIPASVTIDGADYDVKVIDSETFLERGLTSLVLPDTVRSIGPYAFALNGLVSLTVPSSITIIGEAAFARNATLTEVIFQGPPPTITPMGAEGSFGENESVLLSYPFVYDSTRYENGYTSPVWQGYASRILEQPDPVVTTTEQTTPDCTTRITTIATTTTLTPYVYDPEATEWVPGPVETSTNTTTRDATEQECPAVVPPKGPTLAASGTDAPVGWIFAGSALLIAGIGLLAWRRARQH